MYLVIEKKIEYDEAEIQPDLTNEISGAAINN